MHSVLQELKKDFGIHQIEPVTVTIGGHTWTLRPLDPSDYDWATGIATRVSGNVSDPNALASQMMGSALKIERATTAACIAAIDGVPVFEIFEVPTGSLQMANPLRPPAVIRFESAKRVLDFLSLDINIELPGALSRAYTENIEPKLSLEQSKELAEINGDPLDGSSSPKEILSSPSVDASSD